MIDSFCLGLCTNMILYAAFLIVGFERLMALGSACICLSDHVDQNLLK